MAFENELNRNKDHSEINSTHRINIVVAVKGTIEDFTSNILQLDKDEKIERSQNVLWIFPYMNRRLQTLSSFNVKGDVLTLQNRCLLTNCLSRACNQLGDIVQRTTIFIKQYFDGGLGENNPVTVAESHKRSINAKHR